MSTPSPPQQTSLEGCFVAMVTPFTDDGRLDLPGLEENVEWWISEGVDGLIPSGSTGEFLQLTDEERADLIRRTVEVAGDRVPVVVGTSADGTAEAIEWTRYAGEVGASGVMVVAPFYSLPTEEEIIAHYVAIGDSTALPVMIYNNPQTTGIDMPPALLARMAAHPQLKYVKESTRDVRRVEEILRLTDGRMNVFAGILAFESFQVGATGWVSVPANVVPRLAAGLYDFTVRRNDPVRGSHINQQLWELMALEDDTGKYVQIPKAALQMMGRPAGHPRLPRLPLTSAEMARLQEICARLDLPSAPS
jgi:4-hydroxy-tetrahydrodipicolinate synthase